MSETCIYAEYIKRILDILISLIMLILLSPILVILIIVNAIAMKGNPFFVQPRPGKNEHIFNLIKFRSMTCEKGSDGVLLPDEQRLTKWGLFLRKTSLDELPELLNILKGDMSFIGPRPLLVSYLPYYTSEERLRHSIRPGLTGYAQIHGRNSVNWDQRLAYDVEYVKHVSFKMDVHIVLKTVEIVFHRSDVAENTNEAEGNLAEIRKQQRRRP